MTTYPHVSVEHNKSIQGYTLVCHNSETDKLIIKSNKNNFIRDKKEDLIQLLADELNLVGDIIINKDGVLDTNENRILFNSISSCEDLSKTKFLDNLPWHFFMLFTSQDQIFHFYTKYALTLIDKIKKDDDINIEDLYEENIKINGSSTGILSAKEWSEELEIFQEYYEWIRGIYGINDYFEFTSHFKHQSKEFKSSIFYSQSN